MAFSQDGRERGGMGVDSADLYQDGWQDLFVANVDREMYSIYKNNHDLTFEDMAGPTGLGRTTLMSGWGVTMITTRTRIYSLPMGIPTTNKIEEHSNHVSYLEPLLLFHNNGRTLENISDAAGPAFQQRFATRGMAVGDFDNDGAIDVLVAVNDGTPVLLKRSRLKTGGGSYLSAHDLRVVFGSRQSNQNR